MAHEILSVKLCQLDDRLARLHSHIHMSESASHSQLLGEIQALERACAEEELGLRKKLELSKSAYVSLLSRCYGEIVQSIQRARDGLRELDSRCPDEDQRAEAKLLLAEYGLDFAHQAADRALLLAMDAIDTELLREEKEERSQS